MSGDGRKTPGLESAISYLLIIGVIISLVLEVIGMALYYHTYGQLGVSRDASAFVHGRDFFTFLFQQLSGSGPESSAIRFMTAGILVLLLTPYVRVVLSVGYFGWEKDVKYVLITIFVLALLTVSLLVH